MWFRVESWKRFMAASAYDFVTSFLFFVALSAALFPL